MPRLDSRGRAFHRTLSGSDQYIGERPVTMSRGLDAKCPESVPRVPRKPILAFLTSVASLPSGVLETAGIRGITRMLAGSRRIGVSIPPWRNAESTTLLRWSPRKGTRGSNPLVSAIECQIRG